jgi:hypothetical protein
MIKITFGESPMPKANAKLQVFLCHASADKPVARELYQRLLKESWLDPWLDEEQLLPGQDWNLEIEKAVEASQAVIICLSSASVSKEGYVQREMRRVLEAALEKPEGTIFILPLRLDECEAPRSLRAYQYVDYFPAANKDRAFQRLLAALQLRFDALQKADSGPSGRNAWGDSAPAPEVSPAPKGSVAPVRDDSATRRILFLAAEPTDAARLRLGQELREIQEKLQLAKLRDRFDLEQRMSVRPVDLSQALLDLQPWIVHFAGHGLSSGELCFENQGGQMFPIKPEALAALFEQFAGQVECVLLNACYSEAQSRAISAHIPYVIGMNREIGDQAALAFSVGFYQALGAGRTIEEAYKLGCVQIQLYGIDEHLTPVLMKKGEIRQNNTMPTPSLLTKSEGKVKRIVIPTNRPDHHTALTSEQISQASASGVRFVVGKLQWGKNDFGYSLHAEPSSYTYNGMQTTDFLDYLGFKKESCQFITRRVCYATWIDSEFDLPNFAEKFGEAYVLFEKSMKLFETCGHFLDQPEGWEYFYPNAKRRSPRSKSISGGDGHNAGRTELMSQAEDSDFSYRLSWAEWAQTKGWVIHYQPKNLTNEIKSVLNLLDLNVFKECPLFEFEHCYWWFIEYQHNDESILEGNADTVHSYFNAHAKNFSSAVQMLVQSNKLMSPFGFHLLKS